MKKIIRTDQAPKALGPYNQGVIETRLGLVFTSGQIGIDPKTGELAGTDIESQARQAFANLSAILMAAGSDFGDVLKVTVYIKDLADFAKLNEIYSEYFTEEFPARATAQASRLPKDALLEMEFVAQVARKIAGKGGK